MAWKAENGDYISIALAFGGREASRGIYLVWAFSQVQYTKHQAVVIFPSSSPENSIASGEHLEHYDRKAMAKARNPPLFLCKPPEISLEIQTDT